MDFPLELAQRLEKGELIAALAHDFTSKEVLMLAWMNKDSLTQTLTTKKVTYWSRSRNTLWVKGESSGHTQELVNMSYDCDGDALLLQVHQKGAACHTGEQSCFHREVQP